MLNVLFAVPRMHPNLREIHTAIVSAGGRCKFLVAEVGASEPDVFPDRVHVSEIVEGKLSLTDLLVDNEIELVLQRSFRGILKEVWSTSHALKIKRIVYDQLPTYMSLWDFFVRPRRLFSYCARLFLRTLTLGPHERLTPVAPWRNRARLQLDNPTHLRFPMTKKKRSSGIDKTSNQLVVCIAKHGQRRKRIRWLIRALEKPGADFNLVLIGSSPQTNSHLRYHSRTMKRILRMKQNSKRVRVLKDLAEQEIHEILGQATLFVLPSKSEPYAISPLEAMSHEVPALISSDSGSVDYVRKVSDFLVFKSRFYRDFQKKLFLLLAHTEFRRGLSLEVSRSLEQNHDPLRFVTRLAALREG